MDALVSAEEGVFWEEELLLPHALDSGARCVSLSSVNEN